MVTETVLITGGAGFIGSHTCVVLLEAGYSLVVLDNFANSSPESLRRVRELAGPGAAERLRVIEGDIRSRSDLDQAFAGGIDAVVHFAGLKAVGESIAQPLDYWDVNVAGSLQQQCHGVWDPGADPDCGNTPAAHAESGQRPGPLGAGGDAASSVADPALASQCLGWCTRRGLAEMCRDGWAWQRANPCGYVIDEE